MKARGQRGIGGGTAKTIDMCLRNVFKLVARKSLTTPTHR